VTVETATYISDLNATYPASGDARSEGDDHLRLLKSTVKATFPNISGAVTPTHTELNYVDGVTSAIQTQLDAKAASTSVGLVLITATDITSATAAVDFTSGISSTYDEYELHIINAVPVNNNDLPWLRTSANAGSSWDSTGGNYGYTNLRGAGTSTTVTNSGATASKIVLSEATIGNTASNDGFSAVIKFFNPAGTSHYKRFHWHGGSNSVGGSNDQGSYTVVVGVGSRYATAALNGVRFMFSTGDVATAKLKLYGVRKS
jgi:hypothetical protein